MDFLESRQLIWWLELNLFNFYLFTGYESSSCEDKNDGYDEHAYTLGTINV